ncbi:hypothetical protein QBC46DRAFT_414234 [Diplogelasinospora grovesii]|uniref:Uncharacterized protein n=1 Tax=Diplogelasinospora grovesii TaxID=303347 RepID=A0AAN6MX05_9PEZI|nr:hypothetical protein QBC46DRAFT_414234 [Diplogelasinospora grovesii]
MECRSTRALKLKLYAEIGDRKRQHVSRELASVKLRNDRPTLTPSPPELRQPTCVGGHESQPSASNVEIPRKRCFKNSQSATFLFIKERNFDKYEIVLNEVMEFVCHRPLLKDQPLPESFRIVIDVKVEVSHVSAPLEISHLIATKITVEDSATKQVIHANILKFSGRYLVPREQWLTWWSSLVSSSMGQDVEHIKYLDEQ